MTFKNIIFEKEGAIALIVINRPEVLNALNTQTFRELNEALDQIEEDAAIGGVLVRGAGDKAFVAGADIAEIQNLSYESGKTFSGFGQRVFDRLENLDKPVIALIKGFALGGGCELAMACHIRFATENSKMGQPEVNLGLLPGYGATQRLPRLIGMGRALELLLSAEMITARRAYEIGLVNQIISEDEIFDHGRQFLQKMLSRGPLAIKFILQTVRHGLTHSFREGLDMEAELFGKACASEDMREGTTAFLQKRKPQFTGK
jgi:enoyl-CoA hydratase/carnithine racemase